MADLRFTYIMAEITPTGTDTLCQFLAPTHQRTAIRAVQLEPQGSSGPSVPLLFDIAKQDNVGTLASDTAGLSKEALEGTETIQTQVFKNTATGSATEPTTTTPKYQFSLHQQSAALWIPPNAARRIVIPGGERYGIRYLSAVFVAVRLCVYLEE